MHPFAPNDPKTRADLTGRFIKSWMPPCDGIGSKPSDLFIVKSGPQTTVDCKPEKPPIATHSHVVNGMTFDRCTVKPRNLSQTLGDASKHGAMG